MFAHLTKTQIPDVVQKKVTIHNVPIWRQQQSVILLFKRVVALSATVQQHHKANVSKTDGRVAVPLSFYFCDGSKGHRKVRQNRLPRFGSSYSLSQTHHY